MNPIEERRRFLRYLYAGALTPGEKDAVERAGQRIRERFERIGILVAIALAESRGRK